jgi:hypothetical protein
MPTRSAPASSSLALDGPAARREQAPSRIAPQGHELVDELLRDADLEQVLAQRSAFALRAAFEPEGGELVRIAAEPFRHPILERAPRSHVEVDERVPEVEDDRSGHALRTRTAVP